ncbi:MAG TPA: HAD-IA family hydrolase [Candidatus Saccharimonadales bacterium]|nr:HAD-IA family hydrolase [Candidatus Saccharimonadales bacterium]
MTYTQKPTIIFDFDGTLADSFKWIERIFREISGIELMLGPKDAAGVVGVVGLARRLNLAYWKLPFMLREGRRLQAYYIDRVQPFNGMAELLRELHDAGYPLMIVSTNTTKNIRTFLRLHSLDECFDSVHGSRGRIGSKIRAIRAVLKAQKLRPKHCILVGDEVRDIEAARAAGIPSIAVEWGFDGATVLARHKPTVLVATPADLKMAIKDMADQHGRG